MFAGSNVSSSASRASSYCGLVCLEREGLGESFVGSLPGYGWCRYHPPAALLLHAGGDQGSSDTDSASASDSSDLNPEC